MHICGLECERMYAFPGYSMIEALKVPCTVCQVADAVFVNHITHQLQ